MASTGPLRVRFLHLADLHLDAPFSGRSKSLRSKLRSAARDAFRQAVRLTIDERMDALLIAGDLFDGPYLTFETELLLLSEIERCLEAGIAVVYCTGNHDPGRAAASTRSIAWPEGMVVFDGPDPHTVEVRSSEDALIGRVTGAGHAGPNETRDLAKSFPRPESEHPHVALLHTQVHGALGTQDHHPYAPSERAHLEASGYDYWALGHVHSHSSLSKKTPIHYSGCVQGRSVRECGPKGALRVDLGNREHPRVEFVELAPLRWERIVVDRIEAAADATSLLRIVERAWAEARREDPGAEGVEWIVRFELSGASPLFAELRSGETEALAEELTARLGFAHAEIRTAAVRPRVSVDDHRERTDVLGAAIRMAETVDHDAEWIAEVAPRLAIDFMSEEERMDYLAGLLRGAPEELVHRLVKTNGESE